MFLGRGTATYLGPIKSNGAAQITGPDASCPGGIANINTETYTSVGLLGGLLGDSITIQSMDVACPTGPSQYHGTGHWTVIGGTGRFAHATGQGYFDGHSDFGAATFQATVSGAIGYPGL